MAFARVRAAAETRWPWLACRALNPSQWARALIYLPAMPAPKILQIALVLACATAVACGGAPEPVDDGDGDLTSGGEQPPAETRMVQVFRTTTPVPVPQPATPREELAEPLQQLWTRTEEIVAIRPPEPPTEATEEAIRGWAEGTFAGWVGERQDAVQGVEGLVDAIGADPIQRSVAAALFGYMYEDTAAGIRGAPIPVEIAEDEELLGVYVESLNPALRPFAVRAVESYAYCATTIAGLGEQSPWLSWGAYCLEHGRDVAMVYELASDQPPADGGDTAMPPAEE